MDMLENLVDWGKKEDTIRALLLLGSRASLHQIDRYSDYDISVFCDDYECYIE
jgi:hypothetical protein